MKKNNKSWQENHVTKRTVKWHKGLVKIRTPVWPVIPLQELKLHLCKNGMNAPVAKGENSPVPAHWGMAEEFSSQKGVQVCAAQGWVQKHTCMKAANQTRSHNERQTSQRSDERWVGARSWEGAQKGQDGLWEGKDRHWWRQRRMGLCPWRKGSSSLSQHPWRSTLDI